LHDEKTLDRYRDYTIMRLFEETGIRLGECLALKIDDIDMKNNVIKLRQTKNKKAPASFYNLLRPRNF